MKVADGCAKVFEFRTNWAKTFIKSGAWLHRFRFLLKTFTKVHLKVILVRTFMAYWYDVSFIPTDVAA